MVMNACRPSVTGWNGYQKMPVHDFPGRPDREAQG